MQNSVAAGSDSDRSESPQRTVVHEPPAEDEVVWGEVSRRRGRLASGLGESL